MLIKVISIFSMMSISWAIELREPDWPTQICATLPASLKEGPVGYLPEAAEDYPDTLRIQQALNNCKAGKAVKLIKGHAGDAFLSGPIDLPSGVTLWIDSGVTLFASRNPRDFDKKPNSCGVLSGTGCKALLNAVRTKASAVVGEGIIDGRGGQKLLGSQESWWDLAARAQRENQDESCARLMIIKDSQDFTLYKIRLHNSPNFHVVAKGMDGFIVWGVTVDTPSKAYPEGTRARNTDAFDPNGNNIVFNKCYINTGDDHIAIKGGGSPVSNVWVQDCHFYKGHGMSIGSETYAGVHNVTVKNLSIDGADNGLRIKSDSSRGGVVSGIYYENICIRDTDAPLVFDSYYSNKTGAKIPDFHDITVSNTMIVSSSSTNLVFRGYKAGWPVKVKLNNVCSDVKLSNMVVSDAEITVQGVGNIPFKSNAHDNVKIYDQGGQCQPLDCNRMFVPLPR